LPVGFSFGSVIVFGMSDACSCNEIIAVNPSVYRSKVVLTLLRENDFFGCFLYIEAKRAMCSVSPFAHACMKYVHDFWYESISVVMNTRYS
jgi:hypothetical protein